MANYFDQFDEPASLPRAGAPAPGGNFFDQFDDAEPEQGAGLFMNATAGLNEGIYGTLGAPVDLLTGAINLVPRGINAAFGTDIPTIEDPIGGSRSIAKAFDAVGVPDQESVDAVTPGEKVARGAGQGAGYMVAPELAIRGGAQALGRTVSPYLEALFGRSTSVGDAAGNAVVGAAAGAGGSVAGQTAPEPVKPLAEMAGNLVGGGVGALATGVPRMAAEGARLGREFAAPLTAGGRERIASTTLHDAASDPYRVRELLDAGSPELVPGSKPTTFQQTGDMGLGGLERAVQTRRSEPFQQRRADQNSARQESLGKVQPEGQPAAVSQALKSNLERITAEADKAVNDALTVAARQAQATGPGGAPEEFGTVIRNSLQKAKAVADEQERVLWGAVDPDGTLALPMPGTRQAAISIVKEMPQLAGPLGREEGGIIQDVTRFATSDAMVAPFRELAALRTRLNDALREERSIRGETQVYRRLSILRSAVESDIDNAVQNIAARQADAVAKGTMREEDTLLALVQRQVDEWTAHRAARAAGQDDGAGSSAGPGIGTSGRPAISGVRRAEREGGGRSGDTARDPGLPGNAGLIPNFDEAAAGRLKTASAATRANAETFGRRSVADTLQRPMAEGPYNLPASVVGQRFFTAGPSGFARVNELRKAAGDQEALAALEDYAASALRKASERGDGALDPAKLERWRTQHSEALRAFPELDKRLSTAKAATETFERVAAVRKQRLDEYQAGLVGRLIGVEDPSDVTKMVGAVFSTQNPVQTMRRLAAETKSNPDATAGLRKAVADHINLRFVSNTEAAASGQDLIKADAFQQFIKANEPALRVIFKPDEVSAIKAIAADIKRANRSITAVKLPGQSNTAQDLLAQKTSVLGAVMQAAKRVGGPLAAGTTVGSSVGGPVGGTIGALVGILGAEAVSALRLAGMQNVDDILVDALLNPERASALLRAYPGKPTRGWSISLAQRYRRASMLTVGAGGEEKR